MVKGRCMKCKKQVEMKNIKEITMKNKMRAAKGVCPISCPRAIASIRSSFRPRNRPIVLETFETSCTWRTLWVT